MQLSLLRRTSDRQHKNAKTCTKTDLLNWFALELPVWWQDIGNVVKSRSSSYCFVSKFLSHYSAVCWFSRYFFKVSGLSGGGGHTRTAFYLSLCHVRATGISFFSTGCCLKWCIFCCLTILGSEYFDVSLCCVWIGRQHRRLSSFLCCPPNVMSSKSLLLTLLISKREVRKYQKWWTPAKNRKEKWWNC